MLPPPQYGELSVLTTQVANGNDFARERLISLYMRNALKIALSMTKQYELDIEDAVSVGLIGLISAVDRYDPNGSNPPERSTTVRNLPLTGKVLPAIERFLFVITRVAPG